MHPSDLLRRQLEGIDVVGRLSLSSEGSARLRALIDLQLRLIAFDTAYRDFVLPALKAQRWKGVRSDVLEEAVRFRAALARLLSLGASDSPSPIGAVGELMSVVAALRQAAEASLVSALDDMAPTETAALSEALCRAFNSATCATAVSGFPEGSG